MLPWLPAYALQVYARKVPAVRPVHLVIAVADHFEPSTASKAAGPFRGGDGQLRHVEKWCREYPKAISAWRDEEGQPLRHTYFYPAEEYNGDAIDCLTAFCHAGWGEIEIHLHHGINAPDTAENTRRALLTFRDQLVARGCLSREKGIGAPRYAFVHGNWALANSAQGRFCGVDEEMQILAETGCYGDFTLPAPSSAQVRKINALYECALPLNMRAPHRRGIDLRCNRPPRQFPLIIQGPLLIFGRLKRGLPWPGIENGELSGSNPPTMDRLRLWRKASIIVKGRPDWIFIKLHCHGMNPGDETAMFGTAIQKFLRDLVEAAQSRNEYKLHFVTAREMANIILAACDGREGNPGEYRDYRFQLFQRPVRSSSDSVALLQNCTPGQ